MDLDRLLQLNNSYQTSHDNIVNLLQAILEKGSIDTNDKDELDDKYSKNDEDYNNLNKAENEFLKNDLQTQIDILKNTKIDLDIDSVLNLLTNDGRTNALFKDSDGKLIINAAKLEDLEQVRLTVDEQGKQISSVIADTEIEQEDGTKVKLKVLFTTLDQRVDGITSTVGEIEGTANDAKSTADANVTKISQVQQTVDGLTTTVQEVKSEAETASTKAEQTAEKFLWIVKDGSTLSALQLTDEAIQAIASSDIVLGASHITLEGLVTANENFKILEDGSIEAVNGKFTGSIDATSGKISSDLEVDGLNVSGNISTDTLTVRNINCANLLSTINSDINVTVDSTSPDINNTMKNGGIYGSLQKCISDIPKNLNRYILTITVNSELSERIQVAGFNGGELRIMFNKNLNGFIYTADNTAKVLIRGKGTTTQTLKYNYKTTGNLNMREKGNSSATIVQTLPAGAQLLVTDIDSNNWGYTTYNGLSGWISLNTSYTVKEEVYETTGTSTAIIPDTLVKDGMHQSSIFADNCNYVSISNIEVYSKTDDECYAIKGYRNSFIYAKNVKVNGSSNGIVAQLGARIYTEGMSGKVTGKADSALMGSTIYIADGTNINGTLENDSTSQIIYNKSSVTEDTTSDVGENTNTTTAASVITINSTSGDTYRSTVYNNWKKDNTVRQGDYGYGDCNGCWFFGTQFTQKLQGKTITKLTITVTRQAGGISGDRTATLKMHGYDSRPSGSPSYISDWSMDFTIGIGDTKTLTITDSTVLDAIKGGTCIGFGVQGIYDSTHYIVFAGNCTVTATIQG